MEIHGIRRINKKRIEEVTPKGVPVKKSFFSKHWREYLDPESDINKQVRKMAAKRAGV